MLQKFEISGVHTEVNENLRKYITKKLGKIDRYLPRPARASAHMEVRLKEDKIDGKTLSTCDVTLRMPHDTIKMKESTLNMYASVDIIQAKLKQQIERYKESKMGGKRQRKLFARSRRLAF
ncbi:MAG TPA: ribosome-associated translation inhibitor RaiA [Candidatus Saccharimonadales bacterium]|nr:ribosome-associated translation inhibitor RaiA [Candidatus Saccharimonadales bacterium]